MMIFFYVMSVLLGLIMALSLYRVIKGPTNFDRLTGLGLIGTKTVVLLVLLGILQGRVDLYIDIALTYGLIGFIGPLAIAKYFEIGGRSEP
jgi:multicomponent Na+:H+ antiporter subunit F